MDEGQGRGTPAAHARVRLSDRPQTPSRRQRVEGCSQSQGNVRSQNAGESRSSLSRKGASARRLDADGVGGPDERELEPDSALAAATAGIPTSLTRLPP